MAASERTGCRPVAASAPEHGPSLGRLCSSTFFLPSPPDSRPSTRRSSLGSARPTSARLAREQLEGAPKAPPQVGAAERRAAGGELGAKRGRLAARARSIGGQPSGRVGPLASERAPFRSAARKSVKLAARRQSKAATWRTAAARQQPPAARGKSARPSWPMVASRKAALDYLPCPSSSLASCSCASSRPVEAPPIVPGNESTALNWQLPAAPDWLASGGERGESACTQPGRRLGPASQSPFGPEFI